jgi:tetratricopeptide (TPR) repeat protein
LLEELMRKTVNWRYAAFMAGSLAVLGTATHFLHAYQVKRTAGGMLERAGRVEADGQLELAADYLGRYLSLKPDDMDVLAKYGSLLADDRLATTPKAKARAWFVLNKVLYREPERYEVRRQVVRLAMATGQFDSARHDLEGILLREAPHDGELNELAGRCCEATGKYVDARKYFMEAIRNNPHNLEAYVLLARLLRTQTQNLLGGRGTTSDRVRDHADSVMNDMVKQNDTSHLAYLKRADYFRFCREHGTNKSEEFLLEAEAKDVAAARKLAPEEADVYLAAAELAREQAQRARDQKQLAREQSQVDEARQLLRRGRDRHPTELRMYLAAARVESDSNNVDAAIACLREGLTKLPGQTDLLWDLGRVLTFAGRKDQANEVIGQLGKNGWPRPYIEFLHARLDMNEERWHEAIKKLEGTYADLSGLAKRQGNEGAAGLCEQVGLWLGECFEEIGDFDRAYETYGRVVALNANSIPGRRGMAMSRWSQGRLHEALEQVRQLLKVPGSSPEYWAYVARLVFRLNIDDVTRPEVDAAIAQAERLEPLPVAVAVLRAEYWAAQRKFDEARTALDKFGEAKTRPVEVWAALSVLDERQGSTKEALKLLDEAQRVLGDSVDLRLARSRYWLRRGPDTARTALPALAANLDRFSPADRRRLRRGLADAFVQAGLREEAVRLWRQLADEHADGEEPSDLRSRIALFDLAAATGDQKEMDHWQSEIRRVEGPDGVVWRLARASALVGRAKPGSDHDRLAEAHSLLAEVNGRRPNWSRAILCEARLNDVENHKDVALTQYQEAIKLGERDPWSISRAVALLHERGRDPEASDLLKNKVSPETLLPQETQRVAAEVALRTQDRAQAVALAEKAVTADSKDYHQHLWFGVVCWSAGQPDRAETAFLKARDLAPEAPEVWTTLVSFLTVTGRKDRAVAEVASADRKLTSPAAMPSLALCHELVGHTERARELYEAAIAKAGADMAVLRATAEFYLRTSRRQQAQQLLERLVTSESRDDRLWARRLLAPLLAADRSPAKLRKALDLLEGKDASPPGSPEADKDQRTRALLLAGQDSAASRRAAARIFDDLIDRKVATPQDRLAAAQLYEQIGDWSRARQHYVGLLSQRETSDPNLLLVAARSLIRHNEPDLGRQALERLEKEFPSNAAKQEIRARLVFLQDRKRKDEAVALIRDYATTQGASLLAVANALEEFGEFAAAEDSYRAFAARSGRPQDMLVVAYFLIRQRKYVEALDVCDQCWASCPPVEVAQVCLVALSAMPADPDWLRRVSARLEPAVAAAPDQVNLLAALAAVRNFQGRFDDAVALYRQVLKADENHRTALNNLVWLLALQDGHAQEAVELIDKATKAETVRTSPGLRDTRAVAHLATGRAQDVKSAVEDLELLVAEAPSATFMFHLARAYDQLGRTVEAKRAWQAAKTQGLKPDGLHPLERDSYERLARVLN